MSFKPLINVLIVDDDKNYVTPQIDLAANFNIDLYHKENWEEAEAELNQRFDKYQAIIIDGKGQLNQDSKKEDSKHLSVALNWLKEQKGRGNHIHYVINTGFHEELQNYFGEEIMYDKSKREEKQMFEDILKATTNLVKTKYPDIFEVFEKYLPDKKAKANYENLVKELTYGELSNRSGICKTIRRIQESIFKYLNEYNKEILSDDCFKGNGMIEFKRTHDYLSGIERRQQTDGSYQYVTFKEDVIGAETRSISEMIYLACGSLIHFKKEGERPYDVSPYLIKSLFFALNEQLLWYKNILEKH